MSHVEYYSCRESKIIPGYEIPCRNECPLDGAHEWGTAIESISQQALLLRSKGMKEEAHWNYQKLISVAVMPLSASRRC